MLESGDPDVQTRLKTQQRHYNLISDKSQAKKRKRKERPDKYRKFEETKTVASDSSDSEIIPGLLSPKNKTRKRHKCLMTDDSDPVCEDELGSNDREQEEDSELAARFKSSTKGDNDRTVDEGKQELQDEESELKAVKAELSQLSFEELQKLQGKLGVKVFNQVMHGTKSQTVKRQPKEKVLRRENKTRPMEMSSKKAVSRFRHIIPTKKKVVRDPRFDEKSGVYSEEYFKKSYSFLEDVKEREREKLQKQLRQAKDGETRAKIKSVLHRMNQQRMADDHKAKKAEKEKEWNMREKELVAQGKKPFFLKKSDKRKLELAEKYRELQKSGKLEKYLSKKRKKNSQKERRKMVT